MTHPVLSGGGVVTEWGLCEIFGGDDTALQQQQHGGTPGRPCGEVDPAFRVGLPGNGQLVVSAVSSTTNEVWRDESSTPLNEIVTVCPANDDRSNDFWL